MLKHLPTIRPHLIFTVCLSCKHQVSIKGMKQEGSWREVWSGIKRHSYTSTFQPLPAQHDPNVSPLITNNNNHTHWEAVAHAIAIRHNTHIKTQGNKQIFNLLLSWSTVTSLETISQLINFEVFTPEVSSFSPLTLGFWTVSDKCQLCYLWKVIIYFFLHFMG